VVEGDVQRYQVSLARGGSDSVAPLSARAVAFASVSPDLRLAFLETGELVDLERWTSTLAAAGKDLTRIKMASVGRFTDRSQAYEDRIIKLHADYKEWLEALAPHDPERYRHNRTGEDNGDAHHKRQIMGREVVVAITNGKLDFGPWEQIFYGEFDGRRPKRVLVKIIGE